MKSIEFIQVPSDLGSGRRGAGLGISALHAVAQEEQMDIFHRYPRSYVPVRNEACFYPPKSSSAKYLEEIKIVIRDTGNKVKSVLERAVFPIILAGDHSTAAGSMIGSKLYAGEKRLGVVWIDAHADLHTPYTTPTGNVHGMPVAMAAAVDNMVEKQNHVDEATSNLWNDAKKLGWSGAKIDLEDFVLISGRALENQEQALMRRHGIKNFTVPEVRKLGVEEVVKQSLSRLAHCDYLYISFDVDSMDPSISRGTGTPVPNGLTDVEALEINKLLIQSPKVIAWEMVEINPLLDIENKMAKVALNILDSMVETLEKQPQEIHLDS